jgi:two-component system response regulator PhoP
MRILVVEDEAALRESLKRDLSAAGHTVDVAADGEEGLYAALEYPIDVAIVDLGPAQGSRHRADPRLRELARPAVSSYSPRDRWQDKVEG